MNKSRKAPTNRTRSTATSSTRRRTRKPRQQSLLSPLTTRWRKAKRTLRRWLPWLIVLIVAIFAAKPVISHCTRQEPPRTRHKGYDGIDVSKHNGRINWKTVARDKNIKFVYIKATEGASVVDKRYKKNLREARAAGLKVGSYHFFRGYKSAKEQFALFSKHVKKSEQDLLPMVDVEQAGNSQLSRQRLQKELRQFMELCKKHYGRYPLLYSQYRFYNEKLAPEFNRHLIFIARYGTAKPTLRGGARYNIWQYSERGKVAGINGYVDLDRFANGTTLRDISF